MDRPLFSFVLPVCNEAEVLEEMHVRLSAVSEQLDGEAEFVFVDDGSTDGSGALLVELHGRDPRVKVIRLARNFGHQIAITAGLDAAAGDAIVIMDCDLQDPPEVVPELVARWCEGYEIVYAVRGDRRVEPFFRRLLIRVFYRVLRRATNVDIPVDAGDFRLVDRKALEAFKALRETNRYVRGLFSWIGFRQIGVPYSRAPRFAGKTKYPYRKLVKLASDGVVSFSNAPLRVATGLGFAVSTAAFSTGIVAAVLRLAGDRPVPGWASLVLFISFLGGIQLIVIGMVGVYVARIYDEVKGRPLYLVRETCGFTPDAVVPAPSTAVRGDTALESNRTVS